MDKTEFKVQIDGIALRQATDEKDNWLPDVDNVTHYPPYTHQVKMRDIIENNDRFVAINTTSTGGGKTFSYAVPVIRQDMFSIVVFPTNALTADQQRSISELATEYFPDKSVYVKGLTGNKLQKNREKTMKESPGTSSRAMSNTHQIQRALENADRNTGPSFILTNPDIFLGILRGKYGSVTRQKLELSDIVVVDEFHHATPKGKNSLIMAMDELYHRDDNRCNVKRFVFLSATPDETVEKQLSDYFGFKDENIYHKVDSSNGSKPVSELSFEEDEPYNPVMPQVTTTFVGSRPFSTKDKIRSNEYLDKIVEFSTTSRTIVILDGVAEVNDVYQLLDEKTDSSTRVEPISGLRSDNTSEKLNRSDIIVANSTLEVGVDIGDVENLIFSGYSASRFTQRLGRLRAEPGSIRKSAVCFTTPDMIQTMQSFKELEKNQIPRKMMESAASRELGKKAKSDFYKSEFSPVEMYRAIENRAETMYESEEDYRRKASKIVAKHCFKSTDTEPEEEDIDRMWELANSSIGSALQSYRQSSLNSLVYDCRTNGLKTYSIPSLLRLADIEFLTEPEFDNRLEERGLDPDIYDTEKSYVQTYSWMNGYKSGENLRNPHVLPSDQLRNQLSTDPVDRKPMLLDKIEFTVDENEDLKNLSLLNKQLRKSLRGGNGSDIIGYSTEGHPAEIQTVYNLDEFFFTNPIANMNGEYTLATGENALYLYGHIQNNIRSAHNLYDQYK